GLRAHQPIGAALGIAHRKPARQHPAIGPILVAHAVLVLEVRGGALADGEDAGLHALEVVGVHAPQPLLGRRADLLLREAEDGLPARREIDDARAQVPVPEAVVGAADGQRVALLALAQRLFRAAALADLLLQLAR